MPSFACVVLVDRRGWLLLQERDEHAPIDPETWGMCGGHVEDGEDVETAAYRELLEETGLDLPTGTLRHHTTLQVFHEVYGSTDPVAVFVAGVDLTDDDVECHEGRRIVLVDPATLGDLPLSHSAAQALPALVGSSVHHQLRWQAHGDGRLALTCLVDRRGWVLMQERDEHAPVAPDTWTFPGGGVEEGESYAEAARRELEEETGVRVPADGLELIGSYRLDTTADGPAATFELWAAATDLTDADIECHEGRQMVFVDPTTFPDLSLARPTVVCLDDLLQSDLYRELTR